MASTALKENAQHNGSLRSLAPPRNLEHATVWLAEAIAWAHERGGTDMHFFPSDGEAMLWVRIDGDLCEVARYTLSIHERMLARLKVMGRCPDYDGLPVQEGRFSLSESAEHGEVRLSIIPTLRGEKAVLRLMTGGGQQRRLSELGFSRQLVTALRHVMDRPQGLVLATGPSGCGKSTTIYALLADLAERSTHPVSILTIEDPVEQSLACAAQVGVQPARGLDFPEGLKALLRQDPEVIMVGEIRDAETANTALNAALTGHRLLSSMHTLTASEALVRLQQMGAPSFVITSAMAGVLSVRLLRLLCAHCRSEAAMSEEERRVLPESAAWESQVLAQANGCEHCLGSGHQGRVGLGEWCIPTPQTAEALDAHRPAHVIEQTLEILAPARPAALELLAERKIDIDAWYAVTGLASMQQVPGTELSS